MHRLLFRMARASEQVPWPASAAAAWGTLFSVHMLADVFEREGPAAAAAHSTASRLALGHDQLERLRRDGYIVIDGCLSAPVLASARSECISMKRNGAFDATDQHAAAVRTDRVAWVREGYGFPGERPQPGILAAVRELRSVALMLEGGSNGAGWAGFAQDLQTGTLHTAESAHGRERFPALQTDVSTQWAAGWEGRVSPPVTGEAPPLLYQPPPLQPELLPLPPVPLPPPPLMPPVLPPLRPEPPPRALGVPMPCQLACYSSQIEADNKANATKSAKIKAVEAGLPSPMPARPAPPRALGVPMSCQLACYSPRAEADNEAKASGGARYVPHRDGFASLPFSSRAILLPSVAAREVTAILYLTDTEAWLAAGEAGGRGWGAQIKGWAKEAETARAPASEGGDGREREEGGGGASVIDGRGESGGGGGMGGGEGRGVGCGVGDGVGVAVERGATSGMGGGEESSVGGGEARPGRGNAAPGALALDADRALLPCTDNGELILFLGAGPTDTTGASASHTVRIAPLGGRMVLFDSRRILHEVRPHNKLNDITGVRTSPAIACFGHPYIHPLSPTHPPGTLLYTHPTHPLPPPLLSTQAPVDRLALTVWVGGAFSVTGFIRATFRDYAAAAAAGVENWAAYSQPGPSIEWSS
jgi:hypothetical protein